MCFQLIKLKSVNLTRNHFTEVGLGHLIRKTGDHEDDAGHGGGGVHLETLDLSECGLGDAELETISPLVNIVRELLLNDNHFTR